MLVDGKWVDDGPINTEGRYAGTLCPSGLNLSPLGDADGAPQGRLVAAAFVLSRSLSLVCCPQLSVGVPDVDLSQAQKNWMM